MSDEEDISGDYDEIDIIDIVGNDDDSIAYGLDSKMRALQCHYTILKTRYKKLANTWLIATFIGYGYFLKGAEKQLHLDNYLVIAILSILSTIGIFLLYFLDIGIYQQISEATFLESEVMEKKYPFLGTTNRNIMKLLVESKTYPLTYEALLYCGFTSVLLFISDISLFFYVKKFDVIFAYVLFSVYLLLIIFFQIYLVFGSSFLNMTKHVIKKHK